MDKDQLIRRLLKTFIVELEDHARALNRDLMILERDADASTRMEAFRSLFRTGHSLKSAARTVNIDELATAGHHLESVFSGARDGSVSLDPALFELLYTVADALADAGRRLTVGEEVAKGPLAGLMPRLEAALVTSPQSSAPQPSSPPPAKPEPKRDDPVPQLPPPGAVAKIAASEAPTADAFVRIPSVRLDRLITLGGELRVARSRAASRDADLERILEMAQHWQSEWQAAERSFLMGRLRNDDEEATLSGVAQAPQLANRLWDLGNDNLQRLTRQLEQLIAEIVADRKALDQVAVPLEEEVLRARMMPFAEACEGFNRMVRDLAKQVGKDVDLIIEGGEIEIDRSVVASIKDALLHLIRNAVDHGIELPTARVAAGKIERGQIRLTAALHQGWVEIVVADDGRGFDTEAIRTQAGKRGLAVPQNESEIARLAFAPGLTTAPVLTDISGRGVGLDVVKTAIESQRGRYDVTFEPGRGSRVVLTVPLTLTRLPALLVKAGGQTYAFDSAAVRGLRRVGTTELRTMNGRDVLTFDGAPVPVFRLAEILGQQLHDVAYPGGKAPVVILGAGTACAAFTVEELLVEQEVVVKDLGPRLRNINNVTGATVLPNGRIALILNAADLLRNALQHVAGRSLSDALAERPSDARKRLLIADDSVTTRTLVKSILEAAGYDVLDAADGAQAWQILQEKGADLVVSDVEMPRMDGFTLAETIRNSKRFRDVPVILVTALEAEKDKLRGLDAGADAYLLKSAFDQTSLLQAIAQLV